MTTPDKIRGAGPTAQGVSGLLGSLAWAGVGVLLLAAVPAYERQFAAWGIALPKVTTAVIDLAHTAHAFATAGGVRLWAALACGLGVALAGAATRRRRFGPAWATLVHGGTILGLLCFLATLAAVHMPYRATMRSISGG